MKYRAMAADSRSWQQASRPKPCLLATNRSLQGKRRGGGTVGFALTVGGG
jgi:hypothetical protein